MDRTTSFPRPFIQLYVDPFTMEMKGVMVKNGRFSRKTIVKSEQKGKQKNTKNMFSLKIII